MSVQQRATLDDVARLAGVSPKTVSRVYAQREKVSPDTAERVLSAAKRLRFRPNSLARSLRRGGVSTTVGFIMGELRNPFYYTVASGIEKALAAQGFTLIVATTDDSVEGEERVADTLLAQRVGALLLIPVSDDQSYLDGERQLGTPVIAIDRPARNLVADAIVLENRRGAVEATTALIAGGHRRIAYVCNPASVYTQTERVRGYREALIAGGIDPDPRWERLLDDPTAPADAVIRELLDQPDPPTAIIAGNNRVCVGALRALRDLASPPALIGFDDFETADVLGVTVVGHDPAEMGRRAALLAIERMADPTAFTTQIELPTRLIPRGSGERPPATETA
ncbi:LacI family transcriptional regulator [Microbacterium terrae]|uniref:Ribose operon repressor n=1 Tax=Microbacterium terrae TaxID=69369 RepID=A0A0M2HFN7_9MICO|nr:LacI family DNA-binding transcriptional regulator [Microbacterium terrae]KJL45493.1 Ribose operon repressor [Microbacterium terrae]MBP1078454.1 LacI family transcriptional regulator [Microbacterium terrae]GLJ99354.1 LacI family transcriptional regulator [Microbacterium terrae]